MMRRLQQSGLQNCQICNPLDGQTKAIILSLFDSIALVTIEQGEKVPDIGGFSQLIKMIFHNKYKNLRVTLKCKHENLKQLILQKLDIDSAKLDFISNKKACDLAKRSFHIDTISLQIKSFTRHFTSRPSDKLMKTQKQSQRQSKQIIKEPVVKEEEDENVETFNRLQNKRSFPPIDFQFSQMISKMGFIMGNGINYSQNR